MSTFQLYEQSDFIFEMLHADWPTYPMCKRMDLMLVLLSIFDEDTVFYEVDDIDECKLFQVGGENPYGQIIEDRAKDNLFISISHKTLSELIKKGALTGYTAEILDEYYKGFYESGDAFSPMGEYKIIDGVLRVYDTRTHEKVSIETWEEREKLEELDEEYELHTRVLPFFPDGKFSITHEGHTLAEELAKALKLPDNLEPVIYLLLENDFLDQAIRECSVIFESKLKVILDFLKPEDLVENKTFYGRKLVKKIFKEIGDDKLLQSGVALKSECHTFFKYIRNEYMHNEKGRFRKAICLSLIYRYSILTKELDVLFDNIKEAK